MKDFGINAELVCDPIYSLQISKQAAENSVGIQLRDFKTVNINLLNKLAQLIANKFPDKTIEIFSLQKSQDYEISKKFESILQAFNHEIDTKIVEEDIAANISKLEYLFAMRFHAILAALKCGVKTCAINYDIKVEKLASDANIPIISMDAHENFEEIYSKLQKLEPASLKYFADNKIFDWSIFDEFII